MTNQDIDATQNFGGLKNGKMKINADKTMVISSDVCNNTWKPHVEADGEPIDTVRKYKFLGGNSGQRSGNNHTSSCALEKAWKHNPTIYSAGKGGILKERAPNEGHGND